MATYRSAGRCAGLVALLASLAACDRPPDQPPAQFSPGPVPAEFARGERLFNANCIRCHGSLALGTAQGPPLVHIYYEPNHHSDVAFQRAVRFGSPAHHWDFGPMPSIAGVTEAEVTQITAYIRWLQREAGIYQ